MTDSKGSAGKKKSASASKKDDAPAKPASIILAHRPIMSAPTFSDQPLSEGDSPSPPTAPKLVTREPQLKPLSAPIPAEVDVDKAGKEEDKKKEPEKSEDKADSTDEEKEETSIAPKGELKLATLESEEKTEDKPEDKTEDSAQPDNADEKDGTEKSDDAEKSEDKPAEDAPESSGGADEDEKSQPELSNKEKLETEAAEREAKHDAEIDKMVDSKKYFLPINAVEKRKTKRFVFLGIVVSVVLAIAWVDVALDAGLIHIDGVKPFTHFFSN